MMLRVKARAKVRGVPLAIAIVGLACAPAPRVSVEPAAPTLRCPEHQGFSTRARLPFGLYSLPVDRFAQAAQAGVTMVGPYYGTPPAGHREAARAHDLGVIEAVGHKDAAVLEPSSLAELDAQIDEADRDTLAAWYVLPEERRPWVAADLDYLEAVRARIRKRDPKGHPVLGYQPNHRDAQALARASVSFDVVSRGVYTNYVGAMEQRAWVGRSVEAIVAASGPEQTAWVVLEMFEQPSSANRERIAAWVRHDVFASVVHGARGILVFSGWPREGFAAYERYLAAYLETARMLNADEGLATVLLGGEAREAVHAVVVGGPATARVALPREQWVTESVATRALHLEGATWVFAVNSAQAPVSVELRGLDSPCAPQAFVGPSVHDGLLDLPALGVAALRVADPQR